MPASIVIYLKTQRLTRLPSFTGPALHAAFFDLLARVDEALATELHDLKSLKPFTISDIKPVEITASLREFRPGSLAWFRITSLDARLDRILEKLEISKIRILSDEFNVSQIVRNHSEHVWAGHSSWEEIISKGQNRLQTRLKFTFHSLTTFKNGNQFLPLPLPEYVFNSLMNRWNTFSPYPIEIENLTSKITVNRYELSTDFSFLEGAKSANKVVGFKGYCEYGIPSQPGENIAALNTLASFSFYSGIGHKTTMGLGQATLAE